MEYIHGLMEENMLEIGRTVSNMVKLNTILLMELSK
jgi:hypothetical protein